MEKVYDELNIKYRALGCSMLKVEPLSVSLDDVGGDDVLYVSKNPDLPWVNGFVNGKKPHVTLLYGLLDGVKQHHVDIALKGLDVPESVKISGVGTFPSPIPSEPYTCIVAHVDVGSLVSFNDKLRQLPHISRYPGFKAHLTIAYVKKEYCTPELLDKLNHMCKDAVLSVRELKFEPAGTPI